MGNLKIGQYLGVGAACMGFLDLLCGSLAANSPQLYAISPVPPPVSVEQVQQWGPVLGAICMAGGGTVMGLWFKFTSGREERIKASVKFELKALSQAVTDVDAELDRKRDELRADMKNGFRSLHDEVSDLRADVNQVKVDIAKLGTMDSKLAELAVTVGENRKFITDTRDRGRERAAMKAAEVIGAVNSPALEICP